jgi:pimeloyl-ACP methyl ester carboxylesterase
LTCLLIEEYQPDRPIAIQTLDSDGGPGRHFFGELLMKAIDERAGDDLVGGSFGRCYRDDPLVYRGRIRARTGAEILAVRQRLPAALPPPSVPLLVLHGTDDQIWPLAGSVMVHEAVSSAYKIPRRYPGLYHRVFNEPEREQILTDSIFWLAAYLPSNGSVSHSAG